MRRFLGDVAHDRHRPVERTTTDHAQLHRREVLGLVDADVAVGTQRVLVALARSIPEQSPCLIEERDVVEVPHHVAGVPDSRLMEAKDLLVGEVTLSVGRAK